MSIRSKVASFFAACLFFATPLHADGIFNPGSSGGGGGAVSSVSGTAGQVTCTPSTGNVVCSLPSTITANLIFSGTLAFSGLNAGTQVSCLGLDSGNNVVLNAAACGSGGGGAVSSVFGRTGAVVAASNDYNFNQLAGNYTLAQGPTIGANTVLGSIAGGTPAALSQTQLTSLVNVVTTSANGAAPTLPNDATKFFNGVGSYITAVTQITFGNGTNAVTCNTTCTVNVTEAINSLTGANPAILTAAWGEFSNLNNAGAQTPTIAQAGTTGFPAGSFFDIANTGAGVQTLTPGGGTVGGASTLVFPAGSATTPRYARLISDGSTNYQVVSSTLTFTAGPSSAVSGDIATFNGTTGLLLQDSGILASSLAPKGSPTFTGTVSMPDGSTFASGAAVLGGTLTATSLVTSGTITGALCIDASGHVINNASTNCFAGGGSGNALFGTTTGNVANNIVTMSNTTVGVKDSGVAVSSLAPLASPTFTGTVTAAAVTTTGIFSNSQAGALSASAVNITGAPVTGGSGTTTFPLVYINSGAAPTTFATAGTALGINTPSGFTGNLIDTHVNGGQSLFFIVATSASAATLTNTALSTSATPLLSIRNTSANSGASGIVNFGNGTSNSLVTLTLNSSANATGNGTNSFTINNSEATLTGGLYFATAGTNALTISKAQLVALPAITTDAALTDTTVCQDTTAHGLHAGSGTAGICLGNVSSIRFKRDWNDITNGLTILAGLNPGTYRYKEGVADGGSRINYGFKAEDYDKVLPVLTRYDAEGKPNGVDMMGLVPVLAAAIKQQQSEIEDLKRRVH